MGRFCVEDDDQVALAPPDQPKGSKRLTTTRYSLEDSVEEYCFQHGIPKVQPLPSTTLSLAMPPPPTRKRSCGDQKSIVSVSRRKPSSEVRDEMDRLSLLLDAALVVSTRPTKRPANENRALLQQADLNDSFSREERARINSEMRVLRERSDQRNQQNVSKIQALIDASLQAAEEIRIQHEKEQQERERAEAEAKAESDAAEAAAAAAASTAADEAKEAEAAATPVPSPRRDPEPTEMRPPSDSSAKSSSEFVQKAKRLMEKLVGYKESAETFANHPNNKQRRMAMKKLVIRSLNTLTQDDLAKNAQNATALSQAIAAAKHDDEQQQNSGVPEMARGKRFLINFLAADVIKRIQAEGFNGLRGDGFVLATTMSAVAVAARDMVSVLTAHIYTVCPLAIPCLPSTQTTNETEFMKGLGMLQNASTGEFESFERYLSRTESIISFLANIMASEPRDHTLLDGNKGAVPWLARFLSSLPKEDTLPIFTAPVLTGFLTGAGHMLANMYADDFRTLLEKIEADIVPRLDSSAAGAPTVTRLKQTLAGGADSFAQTLPPRALPSLYVGARAGTGSAPAPFSATATGAAAAPSSSLFGGPVTAAASSGPFGGNQQGVRSGPFGNIVPAAGSGGGKAPCKFFFERGNCKFGDRCKFSHEANSSRGTTSNGNFSSAPGPFGTSGAPAPNPFGTAAPSSTPFGNTAAATPSPFGSAPTSQTPFGTSSASAPAPFGTSSTPSPFGGGGPSPSPFGATTASSSPFGGGPPAAAPSPFGGSTAFGNAAPPVQSPFGSTAAAPKPSPFGSTATPSPFGAMTPSPSPFAAAASSPSPFGIAPSATPFGSSGPTPQFGNTTPATSTFGATSSPFGTSTPAATFGSQTATPFGSSSNAATTPFGGTAPTPSPFGGTVPTPSPFSAPSPSPFGATAAAPFGSPAPAAFGLAPSPSPFGSGQAPAGPSPFGGAAPSPSPFGTGVAPGPSPFGSSAAPNSSPFGKSTAPSPSPFGMSAPAFGTASQNSPSPFGSTAPTTFGATTAPSPSPFGATASPFGSSPFGSGAAAPSTTPFGAPTSFGNQTGSTPFGSSGGFGGGTSFGGSNNRAPCKFFRQGNCRFGASCRFSHG